MKLAIAILALSATAMAQISGSAHNFSGASWSGGQICIVCHTPHSATAVAGAPLWNRNLSAATYHNYGAATAGVTGTTLRGTTVNDPGTESLLCLSCHDGTVALENFGGTTNGTTAVTTGLIGTDLRTEHPVGVVYPALGTAGYIDRDTIPGGTWGAGVSIEDRLGSTGNMECSTCHAVHNESGVPSLLWRGNAASALCLTCHDK